jgi:hypothetical protein
MTSPMVTGTLHSYLCGNGNSDVNHHGLSMGINVGACGDEQCSPPVIRTLFS